MSEKYYSELNDIPLYNFEKCLSGDYRFICLHQPEKWSKHEFNAFLLIYEKYIQKYQKKELVNKVNILKTLIELHYMYAATNDKSFLTQIDIKKSQLPKTHEKTESNTTQTLVVLSKFMGYRLNPREISVDEFYTIIRNYERSSQKK